MHVSAGTPKMVDTKIFKILIFLEFLVITNKDETITKVWQIQEHAPTCRIKRLVVDGDSNASNI